MPKRRHRRGILLSAIVPLAVCAQLRHCVLKAFVPVMVRGPAAVVSVEAPTTSADVETVVEDGHEAGDMDAEANVTNITLLLGDGFPRLNSTGTSMGPQWLTCFVEATEPATVTQDGVRPSRNVLEEWVLRGEHEHLSRFTSWRRSQSSGAQIRCRRKSAKSTEDAFCLKCISNAAGHLPFSPAGSTNMHGIMTFGGLDECLASTVGRGFCMNGNVFLPL